MSVISPLGRTLKTSPTLRLLSPPASCGENAQFRSTWEATVASQVERNWAFSPQLAGGNKSLKVGLVFKVLPNGEITDIRYTERSGNSYLDDSAYKAIVKSSPAAAHPPAIKAPYVVVAIRFTPEGMR